MLAEAAGADEDEVLDHLDTALAAGLVHEDGVDRFLFDHALVRDDAVRRDLGPTRRARLHARVAEALAAHGRDGRPRPPGTGWPPGRRTPARPGARPAAAAEAARRLHAYEEAAELLDGQALDAHGARPDRRRRPTATTLLMPLADAHRWPGRLGGPAPPPERAIAVADAARRRERCVARPRR